ncbi:MAG TPA: potassium transporter TrkG, partial [Bacteroidales bacterium]|nr:potassium transporter TrkG [Bacteroidales bacterium]
MIAIAAALENSSFMTSGCNILPLNRIVLTVLVDKNTLLTCQRNPFFIKSALSTTGWQTSNIHHWDWVSVAFIVTTAMFIGGASGATVGGIKMIRALLIKKGLRWQVSKVFLSTNTVKTIR